MDWIEVTEKEDITMLKLKLWLSILRKKMKNPQEELLKFPKPKFQVGDEVLLMKDYTKEEVGKETFTVVEIKLSCISILQDFEQDESYNYSIIENKWLGKKGAFQNGFQMDIRESFLVKREVKWTYWLIQTITWIGSR